MKPGDLVRVSEGRNLGWFTVGSPDPDGSGFRVPDGSIALVLEIESVPTPSDPNDHHIHVLVDGKLGWIYPEDGDVISAGG